MAWKKPKRCSPTKRRAWGWHRPIFCSKKPMITGQAPGILGLVWASFVARSQRSTGQARGIRRGNATGLPRGLLLSRYRNQHSTPSPNATGLPRGYLPSRYSSRFFPPKCHGLAPWIVAFPLPQATLNTPMPRACPVDIYLLANAVQSFIASASPTV